MGNLFCPDAAHLAAVTQDFCPSPDYNPSPLLNILSVNSSLHLSQHYAAVQASLTPQQQQDFTQNLRSTFGREGKVSNGGVGIVALSLAVLFDTVARQVKGEYVSDQELIPGLFFKNPRGTYPPPVYTISKYLRLVPYIANNPTRMRDETEKYLHELRHAGTLAVDSVYTAQKYEDITGLNLAKCYVIGKHMLFHLERLSNKTMDEKDFTPEKREGPDPGTVFNMNCDPNIASERFLSAMDSSDHRTKEAFKCHARSRFESIEHILWDHWFIVMLTMDRTGPGDRKKMLAQTEEFDLKANALGRWT